MRTLVLLDSIAAIQPEHAHAVIISGSHGGRSSSSYAVSITPLPLAVFFNDAGIGKDGAGIFCLDHLDSYGVAAVCYGHHSARIGEADDALESGLVTQVNRAESRLGIALGSSVGEASAKLRFAGAGA